MLTLYQKAPDKLLYNGKYYKLNISFDAVIQVIDLLSDVVLTDEEKMRMLNDILFYGKAKRRDLDSMTEKVFTYLELSNGNEDKKNNSKEPDIIDFSKDADYIYASFMQAYHIDLREQQGKLSWFDFIALFKGLPDGTKIVEVMKIRQTPIPKVTKENKDEVGRLIRAKQLYAIPKTEEEKRRDFQRALYPIAASLMKQVDH